MHATTAAAAEGTVCAILHKCASGMTAAKECVADGAQHELRESGGVDRRVEFGRCLQSSCTRSALDQARPWRVC